MLFKSRRMMVLIGLVATTLLVGSCSGGGDSSTTTTRAGAADVTTTSGEEDSSASSSQQTDPTTDSRPANLQGIALCTMASGMIDISVISPDSGERVWTATIPSSAEGNEIGTCYDIANGRLSPDLRYLGISIPMEDGGTHAAIHDLDSDEVRDVSGIGEPDPDAFTQQAVNDSAPVFSTADEFYWNRDTADDSVFGHVYRGTVSGGDTEQLVSQGEVAGDASVRLGAQGGFIYGRPQGSARIASTAADSFIYLGRVCAGMDPGIVLDEVHAQCPEVLGMPINFEGDVVATIDATSYLTRSAEVVELAQTSSDGVRYLRESGTRSLVKKTTRSVEAVALSYTGSKVLLLVDGEFWWTPSDSDGAEPTRIPFAGAGNSYVLGWLD